MVASPDKGTFQNISRSAAVLDALGRSGESGLRLTDVSEGTGLGKATAHRILAGLVANGLAEQDDDTGRFFVGLRVLSWSKCAGSRHGMRRLCDQSLIRLSERTHDTVYLSMRSREEIVCAARHEGSFPIKTLVFEQGDRRPLGVGAGSLALLSFLQKEELDRIYPKVVSEVSRFDVDEAALDEMVSRTRSQGYALEDEQVISGMRAVALPILLEDGLPIAAISVTAISTRMKPARREQIVKYIREEIDRIYASLISRGVLTEVPKLPTDAGGVIAA